MKKIFSVAIDGPSGAGKSTLARAAAQELGALYADTGAIYRTVACFALDQGVAPTDAAGLEALLPRLDIGIRYGDDGLQHMFLNGQDVTGRIRLPEISMTASQVSAVPAVRQFLLEMQRRLAREQSVLMDGRDIGTVVLPEADVKIFLTADPEERARRRWRELEQRGTPRPFEEVLTDVLRRDENDRNRAVAPLRPAEDAVTLDTTGLTFQESKELLLRTIQERL